MIPAYVTGFLFNLAEAIINLSLSNHTFQWSESETIYVYSFNTKETELEVVSE